MLVQHLIVLVEPNLEAKNPARTTGSSAGSRCSLTLGGHREYPLIPLRGVTSRGRISITIPLWRAFMSQQSELPVIREKNVMVPMRDGVRLAADIIRPDRPGRFPVLVTRGPYGKDGYVDNPDHSIWFFPHSQCWCNT